MRLATWRRRYVSPGFLPARGGAPVPPLPLAAVMLAPVWAFAAAVHRNFCEDEFGLQAALGQVCSDSLLRSFRRNFGIQENQD